MTLTSDCFLCETFWVSRLAYIFLVIFHIFPFMSITPTPVIPEICEIFKCSKIPWCTFSIKLHENNFDMLFHNLASKFFLKYFLYILYFNIYIKTQTYIHIIYIYMCMYIYTLYCQRYWDTSENR